MKTLHITLCVLLPFKEFLILSKVNLDLCIWFHLLPLLQTFVLYLPSTSPQVTMACFLLENVGCILLVSTFIIYTLPIIHCIRAWLHQPPEISLFRSQIPEITFNPVDATPLSLDISSPLCLHGDLQGPVSCASVTAHPLHCSPIHRWDSLGFLQQPSSLSPSSGVTNDNHAHILASRYRRVLFKL